LADELEKMCLNNTSVNNPIRNGKHTYIMKKSNAKSGFIGGLLDYYIKNDMFPTISCDMYIYIYIYIYMYTHTHP
jgi:hypothetical protein